MNKKLMAVLGAGVLTAMTATSAMALENEFHGMYRFFGIYSNFFNGMGNALNKDPNPGFYAEQRARLQYIAKANDDLKLVTHFELDSRFGGKPVPAGSGYLGTNTGNDAGNLDADQLTLETKSVYLDFNCPITKANVKVGLQPWADSYGSLYLLADMTGVYVTKKLDALTLSGGWFRINDDTVTPTTTVKQADVADLNADLFIVDAKYAVNKDVTVGASYYLLTNDKSSNTALLQPSTSTYVWGDYAQDVSTIGLNANIVSGALTIKPALMYQFGDLNKRFTGGESVDVAGWLAGVVTKYKVGSGAINLSAIYLSGDDMDDDTMDGFMAVAPSTQYFNPANMWMLIGNGSAINSRGSVTGNDLTVGGHGVWGAFLGYEGKSDKVFYSANVGYMAAAETFDARSDEEKALGTEINATVGYQLYDNLGISLSGAYVFLGDGLSGDATERLLNTQATQRSGSPKLFGATDADDPYMVNVQLSYTF